MLLLPFVFTAYIIMRSHRASNAMALGMVRHPIYIMDNDPAYVSMQEAFCSSHHQSSWRILHISGYPKLCADFVGSSSRIIYNGRFKVCDAGF